METRSKSKKKAPTPTKLRATTSSPTKKSLIILTDEEEDGDINTHTHNNNNNGHHSKKRKLSSDLSENPKKFIKFNATTKAVNDSNNRLINRKIQNNNNHNHHHQVKKLVIKNYKEVPSLPENFEELMWSKLENSVLSIFNETEIQDHKETLYNAVKDLCSQRFSVEMFHRLKVLCFRHFDELASKILHFSETMDSNSFLVAINDVWMNHCNQMRMIRNIFLYLERTFIIHHSTDVKSIWEFGLSLFATKILSIRSVFEKVIGKIIDSMKCERDGELINRILTQNMIRMLISLQLYHSTFEDHFLEQTTQYYRAEAALLFESSSISEYLLHFDDRLKQETTRVHSYFDKSTLKPVIHILENEFLREYRVAILDKGFELLVDKNQLDHLSILYSFYDKIDELPLIEDYFSKYIKAAGLEIVLPEEKDSSMIEELLNLKLKLDRILESSFKSNSHFEVTLKKSLESAINQRENRPSELLAKFIDSKLKSGKTESEEELERVLDQILSIFRLVQGKDVFQAFYRNDLAKRLLLGKTSDMDIERSLVNKLKHECGAAFTHKFDSMFNDMELSEEITKGFKDSKFANELIPPNFDLNVNILTTGTWPPFPPVTMNLPPILATNQQIFLDYYKLNYKGKVLKWLNSMGHCIVNASFPMGMKSLCVSLFQCSILLLFNSSKKLSYRDFQSALKLNDDDLKLSLQSLACGKVRILVKNPKGKEIGDDDQFIVNPQFTHKLMRIRINSIQMIETKEQRDSTNSHVLVERQYAIDCAIVRIMKERKKLSYTVLVSELYQQLRFPVQPSVIKDRVNSLIDRDYLERSERNDQILHYLA